jgi:GR25 family glycosyltransferase involved in LPS biosynthesis
MAGFCLMHLLAYAALLMLASSQPRVELSIPVSFGGRPTVLQVYEGQTAERAARDYLMSMGYGATGHLRQYVKPKSVSLVEAIESRLVGLRQSGHPRPPFAQFVVPIGVDNDVRLVEMSLDNEKVADVAAAFVDSMPQTEHLTHVRELYVAEVSRTIERALNSTRKQRQHFKLPDGTQPQTTNSCEDVDSESAATASQPALVESHSAEILLMRWLLQHEQPALPAYVINLWSSPYRLAILWQQCAAECIHEMRRFPAVDGVFLSEAVLQELFGHGRAAEEADVAGENRLQGYDRVGNSRSGNGRSKSIDHSRAVYDTGMTQGVIGCFASHLSVWHELEEQGDPFALVLEDDVELLPGFRVHLMSVLRELARRAEEYDLLYLDYTNEHWWPLTNKSSAQSEIRQAGGNASGSTGGGNDWQVHNTATQCIAAVTASSLAFVRLGGVCSSGYSRGYLVTASGARKLTRLALRDGRGLPPHQPVDVFLRTLIADGRLRVLASTRRLIKTHVTFKHAEDGPQVTSDMEGRNANTIFFLRNAGHAGFLTTDGGFIRLTEA